MAKKQEIEFVEEEVVVAENPPELAPNIAFVGKVEKKDPKTGEMKMLPGDPLRKINTPKGVIRLPEDQSRPFFHENAGDIVKMFPTLYKSVVSKGEK